MITMRPLMLLAVFGLVVAELSAAGFIGNLTAEKRRQLGLDRLTPEQQAALDAEVDNYRKTAEAVVAQAAAVTAVDEYRKKQEPAIISQAIAQVKQRDKEAKEERMTSVIQGKFTGWSGRTVFTLENGQVWRQTQSDNYYAKARENVAVVVYKGPGGYWRLRVLDDEGAWVTVTRAQ